MRVAICLVSCSESSSDSGGAAARHPAGSSGGSRATRAAAVDRPAAGSPASVIRRWGLETITTIRRGARRRARVSSRTRSSSLGRVSRAESKTIGYAARTAGCSPARSSGPDCQSSAWRLGRHHPRGWHRVRASSHVARELRRVERTYRGVRRGVPRQGRRVHARRRLHRSGLHAGLHPAQQAARARAPRNSARSCRSSTVCRVRGSRRTERTQRSSSGSRSARGTQRSIVGRRSSSRRP